MGELSVCSLIMHNCLGHWLILCASVRENRARVVILQKAYILV